MNTIENAAEGATALGSRSVDSRADLPYWPFPINGLRVCLRQLRMKDLAAFHAYRSDLEVGRYQGWSPMSIDDATDFIASMVSVAAPRPGMWVQLGITLLDSDTLIGDVGLYLNPEGTVAQIGYTCASAHQRKGLGSEAVRLLLDALQANTNCRRVVALIDSRNIASERLLIRLGFDLEGAETKHDDSGQYVEVTYALSFLRR